MFDSGAKKNSEISKKKYDLRRKSFIIVFRIRVYKTKTCKIWRQFNEKLKSVTEIQNRDELLNEMEFGRRMAIEKDLMKSDNYKRSQAIFDETGKFFIYSTLLGIRVISLRLASILL